MGEARDDADAAVTIGPIEGSAPRKHGGARSNAEERKMFSLCSQDVEGATAHFISDNRKVALARQSLRREQRRSQREAGKNDGSGAGETETLWGVDGRAPPGKSSRHARKRSQRVTNPLNPQYRMLGRSNTEFITVDHTKLYERRHHNRSGEKTDLKADSKRVRYGGSKSNEAGASLQRKASLKNSLENSDSVATTVATTAASNVGAAAVQAETSPVATPAAASPEEGSASTTSSASPRVESNVSAAVATSDAADNSDAFVNVDTDADADVDVGTNASGETLSSHRRTQSSSSSASSASHESWGSEFSKHIEMGVATRKLSAPKVRGKRRTSAKNEHTLGQPSSAAAGALHVPAPSMLFNANDVDVGDDDVATFATTYPSLTDR
jgi:hypothetical protein